jgi:hypothetical protein
MNDEQRIYKSELDQMRENDLSDGGRLHRVGNCPVLGGLEDGAVRFTSERYIVASDLDSNRTP